jgi:hypothetical protein
MCIFTRRNPDWWGEDNNAFSEMGEAKMKIMILAALLALATGGTAMAQGGASSYPKSSPGISDRPIPQAPIGHRQPRAGDVPNEKNLSDPNNPMNKEDAALDRKIKSICRGC